MTRTACVFLSVWLCGCSHRAAPPLASHQVALPPASGAALQLGWLEGRWSGEGQTEDWYVMGHALVGVNLAMDAEDGESFELMFVSDEGEQRSYEVYPDGAKQGLFVGPTGDTLVVSDPRNDFPQQITYAPEGDRLRIILAGGETRAVFPVKRLPREGEDQALMQVEREFAAATRSGGATACASWFMPQGGGFRRGSKTTGADICARLARQDDGTWVDWWPVHAAIRKSGKAGFTVGRWVARDASGKPTGPSGTFATIWVKQADGSWKVRFDGGIVDPASAR